jgi:hypothetical protein
MSTRSRPAIGDDTSRFLCSQWHDYIINPLNRWYEHMFFVDYRRSEKLFATHALDGMALI